MGPRSPARALDLPLIARLARISNLPTVLTNVACGITLSGGDASASVYALLLASVASTYTAGMMLNDAFDREADALHRPERPIPSGAVASGTVFAAGFGLLAMGFVLAGTAALVSSTGFLAAAFGGAALLAFAVVAYDVTHERTRYAPLLMGACRALVYAVAAYTTAPRLGTITLVGMAATFAYVNAVTLLAAEEEAGTLTDLRVPALLAIPAGITLWLGWYEPAGVAFAVLFCGVTFETVRPIWRRAAVPRAAVGQLIAGICLLDAALIAGCGKVTLAVAAALGTVLTRLLQRHVPGT